MKKKAIAFDMDGTLYSSEPLIEKVYADSVREFNQIYHKNYGFPTFKQIEPLIGQPVRAIYLSLFEGITELEMSQLGAIIGREFKTAIAEKGGILFEGVKDVFDFLSSRGFLILIASNGKRGYLQSILDKFSLKTEPFVCVGEKEIQRKGQILGYYLNHYKIGPDSLVMVGDRLSDLEAAQEVQCYFIGCNFGHGDSKELDGADLMISEISQVKTAVMEWLKNRNLEKVG